MVVRNVAITAVIILVSLSVVLGMKAAGLPLSGAIHLGQLIWLDTLDYRLVLMAIALSIVLLLSFLVGGDDQRTWRVYYGSRDEERRRREIEREVEGKQKSTQK